MMEHGRTEWKQQERKTEEERRRKKNLCSNNIEMIVFEINT
jgi:hypothetical protein